MRLLLFFLSSLVLAPLVVLFLVTSGVAPLWLLLPALAFSVVVGLAIVLEQWMRLISLTVLRWSLVLPGAILIGLSAFALVTMASQPWILWMILSVAALTLLVGTFLTPTPTHRPLTMGR